MARTIAGTKKTGTKAGAGTASSARGSSASGAGASKTSKPVSPERPRRVIQPVARLSDEIEQERILKQIREQQEAELAKMKKQHEREKAEPKTASRGKKLKVSGEGSDTPATIGVGSAPKPPKATTKSAASDTAASAVSRSGDSSAAPGSARKARTKASALASAAAAAATSAELSSPSTVGPLAGLLKFLYDRRSSGDMSADQYNSLKAAVVLHEGPAAAAFQLFQQTHDAGDLIDTLKLLAGSRKRKQD